MNTEITPKQHERTVIAAILEGDKDQYRVLVERYHVGLIQHLYTFVHDGDIAEDLAQEAFITAFQKLKQYNDAFAFSTWLYKIGDSLAFRHLKKQKPQTNYEVLEETIADRTPSASERFDQSLQAKNIRQAVEQLPHHYQQVVALYYWDECSYEEIAQVVDRPINTVRTWLRRAKEQLRKELYGRV